MKIVSLRSSDKSLQAIRAVAGYGEWQAAMRPVKVAALMTGSR